ncbi:MAG: 6,7-dimethyl-8-ribityllumazine synthase [Candidatus Hinthialibacter antarcticus]|nr:6,7-dimethyl-8-ribityllumazine synthase [Candidatus Hinthialibacter antarcticus]
MANYIEAQLHSENKKFGIAISRFNSFITEPLLDGALDALKRHGVKDDDITIVRVPGAYEIPLAVKKMAQSKKYAAIIALAAVIRGSTPHFDYVAGEVSRGVAVTSLETEVPISFGVITTNTIEQAVERAGTKMGNKGYDAAVTAVEMANLCEQL